MGKIASRFGSAVGGAVIAAGTSYYLNNGQRPTSLSTQPRIPHQEQPIIIQSQPQQRSSWGSYASLVVAGAACTYWLVSKNNDIKNTVLESTETILKTLAETKTAILNRIDGLEESMKTLINDGFSTVNKQLKTLRAETTKSFDTVNSNIDDVNTNVNQLRKTMNTLDPRLNNMEKMLKLLCTKSGINLS
ncbi:MAG: hypothetical protein WBQ73_02460 [Candidatus Babeliales bacterium]